MDIDALIVELLRQSTGDLEEALVMAIQMGNINAVRGILAQPGNAPRADCRNGLALVGAAINDHPEVMRLLLERPEHAPRADYQDGWALTEAARFGKIEAVRLLLAWPEHAPRADCRDGRALTEAAGNGHMEVVRLLLKWPSRTVLKNCDNVFARMRLRLIDLIGWPRFARGRAILKATENGHMEVVRLLNAM
jgi:ankyrin repeat protein